MANTKSGKNNSISKEEFFSILKEVPKAELHLHLEAAISRKTVLKLYLRRNPHLSEEQVQEEITKLLSYYDLNGFINAYIAIQDLYESVEDLDDVFDDLKDYLVRNGVSYAEVFAAPSAFIKKNWDFAQMVECYRRNILKIKSETGIIVRILIDVSRTFGMENASKNLQLLLAYRIPEIIGIGLGGSEEKGPAKLFGDVFQKARENNLVTVAHAGEDLGPESIWDTIDILKVSRIGHGISAVQDEKLMDTLAERGIPLEICPSSNVFTKKFVASLGDHPLRTFVQKGITITINSDDPFFFKSELLNEYWNVYSEMGFSLDEIKQFVQNSFTASFLDDSSKGTFLASLDLAWKAFSAKKKNVNLSSIKKTLSMIGIPLAVFFISATTFVTHLVSKFTTDQTYKIMEKHTDECVLKIENALLGPMKMTESMAWVFRDGFYRSNSATNEIFENMSLAYPEFSGFYGCRPNNTLFKGPNVVLPSDYVPTSRGWYKGAVEKQGKMFYSDVYVDAFTNALVLTFSQAVYKKNALDGVIAFDYPLTSLQEIVSSLKMEANDKSFILSSEGNFFMHNKYNPEENILSVAEGTYKHVGEKLLNKKNGFITESIDGQKYVLSIAEIPTTGWYYVLGKRVKDVNTFSGKIRFALSATFVLIFLGINLVTLFIVSRAKSKEQEASERLITETNNIAEASKSNAATAQEQNVAVKQIVATMEDNTYLSENISRKIKDVAAVASKTSEDVATGLSHLAENLTQLKDIANANTSTINGIKSLGDKIENIWDIVTLINSVADQAKIIAFNAELEASSASKSSKNFNIVATEIRRLADGIIDGTKEIKEKIAEIQQSSDSLILASETGTEKIKTGVENAKQLEERFENLKNASEITATSSSDIEQIIQQQTVASEQILITIKQIASGTSYFTKSTESLSLASQKLKNIAEDLNR